MSQPLEALQRANEIRSARAALKREVKAQEVKVAEILRAEIPDWLERMSVEKLVLSIPGFYRRTFHRTMCVAGAGPGATVGGLTKRQRLLVAARVEAWEARRSARKAAA